MDSFGLFGVGVPELFLIAILALIFLGPERLPETLRQVAGFIRQLRSLASELTSQFGDELDILDEMNPRKILEEATRPIEETSASLKEAVKPISDAKKDLSKASATLKNAGEKTSIQKASTSRSTSQKSTKTETKSTDSVAKTQEDDSANADSLDIAMSEKASVASDSSTTHTSDTESKQSAVDNVLQR